MNARIAVFCAAFAFGSPLCAADDVRSLLQELSKQVAELKAQSAKAEARIQELEKNLEQERETNRHLAKAPVPPPAPMAAKPEAKPAVTLGDTKGTFKIPGTDTSLGFGGYVKLDVYGNSVSAGADKAGDLYLFMPQIPVSPHRGENSQINFNAREARLWFKSYTPTRWADINTYLELDFFGSADSYTPRLRHAYGSFGNLLAGQTWTTFLNDQAMADTLDLSGPVGYIRLRQPLVRWTQPFRLAGQDLDLQVAAESPRSTLWTSAWSEDRPETLSSPGADRYPDLVARLSYKPDWGNLSLAGMGRQIRVTSSKSHQEDNVWGGAVSLAGRINLFDLDNVRFALNYGNYGRYATVDRVPDAALDSDNNLHLVNAYSAYVAYQHWWDSAWRSNIAYGFEQADLPRFVNDAMTKEAQSVHANLLWSPVAQATLGVEYIYGTRQLIDGRSGNLNRVQFSALYRF
jgi:hypothetical protein